MQYSPYFCLVLTLFFATKSTFCNEKPVIGILTQEIYWSQFWNTPPLNRTYISASYVKAVEASGGRAIPVFTNRTTEYYAPISRTYIAASYVKAVEASGGRVVPVFTNRTTDYYADVVNKVNGILVPGGDCSYDIRFGISRSIYKILKIAKRINSISNDSFPILGICLGFELMLIASIDGKNPLKVCSSVDSNLPLELIPNMEEKSVLFRTMPRDIRNILLTEPVTANHHKKCMTNENFTSMNLDKFWNPITINKADNNVTFISIVEAKNYPFVGLQFHPEKNAWEWERHDPHSQSAIYSARYFYDWFVNECRRNNHSYTDNNALENELIYNYPATYVGKSKSNFEQVYFFNE